MISSTFSFGYCGWNGKVSAVTNGSGLVTVYAYDEMDRVTNIAWIVADGTPLGGFSYAYDAIGRIVSRSHALVTNAFNRTYSYDGFDRLTAMSLAAVSFLRHDGTGESGCSGDGESGCDIIHTYNE